MERDEDNVSNKTFGDILKQQAAEQDRQLLHRQSTEEIDNRHVGDDDDAINTSDSFKAVAFSDTPEYVPDAVIDDEEDARAESSNTFIPTYISTSEQTSPRRTLYNIREGDSNLQSNKTSLRRRHDVKVVGMKNALRQSSDDLDNLEKQEEEVHKKAVRNPFRLVLLGNLAACKVFLYYLITIDSLCSLFLTIGLTLYWYFTYYNDPEWTASSMNWALLGFALVVPLSSSLTMSFNRREQALLRIAQVRSCCYQIYLAHSSWDWDSNGGRAGCMDINWLDYADDVIAQLVGIADELSRFLLLPTATRSRHRLTKAGRIEAVRTMDVAYRLFYSLSTQRMTRLTRYAETLRKAGLASGELSRIRQYERFINEAVEVLRQYKMYRTPQALRSFARIFTLVLPPLYAPTFAELAIEVNSLGVGIVMAMITCLALTALFESIQVLEDPFVAYLTLDGIDVREELEVLNWQQLVDARSIIFPDAPPYPEAPRHALSPEKNESLRQGDVDVELGKLQPGAPMHQRISSYTLLEHLQKAQNAGSIAGSTSSAPSPGRIRLHSNM